MRSCMDHVFNVYVTLLLSYSVTFHPDFMSTAWPVKLRTYSFCFSHQHAHRTKYSVAMPSRFRLSSNVHRLIHKRTVSVKYVSTCIHIYACSLPNRISSTRVSVWLPSSSEVPDLPGNFALHTSSSFWLFMDHQIQPIHTHTTYYSGENYTCVSATLSLECLQLGDHNPIFPMVAFASYIFVLLHSSQLSSEKYYYLTTANRLLGWTHLGLKANWRVVWHRDQMIMAFSNWFIMQYRHRPWYSKSRKICTTISSMPGIIHSARSRCLKWGANPGWTVVSQTPWLLPLPGWFSTAHRKSALHWYSALTHQWILQANDV